MKTTRILLLTLLVVGSFNGVAQEVLKLPTIECFEYLSGPKNFKDVFRALIATAEGHSRVPPMSASASHVFSLMARDGILVQPDDVGNVLMFLGFLNQVFGNHGVSEVIQSKLILDSFGKKVPWTEVYGTLSRDQVNARRLQMMELPSETNL